MLFLIFLPQLSECFPLRFAEKGQADPLKCGQLPVLNRRNVLSKQRNERKSLASAWQIAAA